MPSRSDSSSKQTPPIGGGAIPRVVIDLAPLVALAVLFISSDARFTFIDDEATTLNDAAQQTILAVFRSSAGAHRHLPLYDLLLHVWLALTGGAPVLLRVPSVLFFLVGVWVLSRAAPRIGGAQSATSMIWLACPLALRLPLRSPGKRILLFVSFDCGADLGVSTLRSCAQRSGLGAGLPAGGCAHLDELFRVDSARLARRGRMDRVDSQSAQRACSHPASRYCRGRASRRIHSALAHPIGLRKDVIGSHASVRAALFNAGYKVYVLLVSESVAPW